MFFLSIPCIYTILRVRSFFDIFYVWHVYTKFGCVVIFWWIFSIYDIYVCIYYFKFFFIYKTLRLRSIFDILFFMYDMYLQDLDTLQYFVKYSCILYCFFFIHNMHLQNIEANKYFWYFLLYVWHVSTKFGCVAIFWLIFSIYDMYVHVYYIEFCLSIPCIYELLRVRSILDIFYAWHISTKFGCVVIFW